MAVLYGNDAFDLYFELGNGIPVFEKAFRFFKFKVLKSFKISTDCHIKTCRSLRRRTILEIPGIVF